MMTDCTLLFWIVGGIIGGIPLCIGSGFLFKTLVVKLHRKSRDSNFPNMGFTLLLLILLVVGYVKYIPWGHTKPCPKAKTEQAFYQKPPVDSTGHYIYHN